MLLDFDYTHTNVIFSHANTLPPEYRPSVLKRKTNNEYDEESPLEEREVHFDPNEDRSHLSDEWRKFTKHQSDHAREYFNSKLKLRGSVELFNI